MIQTHPDSSAKLVAASVHSYALTAIAVGVVLGILFWARPVFITTIAAIIIALILEPFVGLLVRLRFPRGLATLVVSVLAVIVLYLLSMGVFNQISAIAGDFPQFKERFSAVVDELRQRVEAAEDATGRILTPRKQTPAPAVSVPLPAKRSRGSKTAPVPAATAVPSIQEVRIHQDGNPLSEFVFSRLGSFYQFLLMASFVPFLVYFMLSWRDHIYRSFLRFFRGQDRVAVSRSLDSISGVARAFVVGNFVIGLLITVCSGIAFSAIRVPYPYLAGGLSGFLTIVPYVGVPLGLMPPILAAIAGGLPTSTLVFIVLIVVALHLVALNVLYPKLVGARVHLNPLVVTFSIMFWGFMWDAAGLVLAIPITAGLKAVCDNVAALRPIGRFLGD